MKIFALAIFGLSLSVLTSCKSRKFHQASEVKIDVSKGKISADSAKVLAIEASKVLTKVYAQHQKNLEKEQPSCSEPDALSVYLKGVRTLENDLKKCGNIASKCLSDDKITSESRALFSMELARCTDDPTLEISAFEVALSTASSKEVSQAAAFRHALNAYENEGTEPSIIVKKAKGWSAEQSDAVSALVRGIVDRDTTDAFDSLVLLEVQENALGLRNILTDFWFYRLVNDFRYADALIFAEKNLSHFNFTNDYSSMYRALYAQPNSFDNARLFYNAFLAFASPKSFFLQGYNTYTYTEIAQGPCANSVLQGDARLALVEITTGWRNASLSKTEILSRTKALLASHGPKADLLTFLGSMYEAELDLSAAKEAYWSAHNACRYYERAHVGLMSVAEQETQKNSPRLTMFKEKMQKDLVGVVFSDAFERWVMNGKTLSDEGQFFLRHGLRFFAPYTDAMALSGKIYIKHTFELMSDVPGKESQRDQRVTRDADYRLWDDVTGLHGQGMAIVSAPRIFSAPFIQHNTAEHEAAHQFHKRVLPKHLSDCVDALYEKAKARGVFVSAYAQESVSEYFAVNLNTYMKQSSPQDPIAKDRTWLQKNDSDFFRLMDTFVKQAPKLNDMTCPI